jgi:hypothetical protein
MGRRAYRGAAKPLVLTSPMTDIDTTFITGTPVGWMDGSDGVWSVTVDRRQPNEEKVLVESRTAGTFLVAQRGYDGTTAQAHSVDATVEVTLTAIDIDEANAHINASTGVHGLPDGDRVIGATETVTLTNKSLSGAANTFTNIPRLASPQIDTALTTLTAADVTLTTAVGTKVAKAGDTMTGLLVLSGDPAAATGAATKQYVDAETTARAAADALKLDLAGGTLSGALVLAGAPTVDLNPATKKYVDDANAVQNTADGLRAYAMAAGTTSHAYGGASRGPVVTSPTFPASRFTVAPIVLITFQTGNAGYGLLAVSASAITTSGFTLTSFEPAAYSTAGDSPVVAAATHTFGWLAIQMTSTTAFG